MNIKKNMIFYKIGKVSVLD